MRNDELKLIEWISKNRKSRANVTIDVGDDLAELTLKGGSRILIGSDMLLADVHFDPSKHSYEQIGRKAILSCLSDCAAMAVKPIGALVSLALPRGEVFEVGQRLLQSMIEAAQSWDCSVIGGDTTSWSGPLAIDVAVVAQPWPGVSPKRRDTAQPGDVIAVTGQLGGSILGKHLNFQPRIAEAHQLAWKLGDKLHALMDISDGLSLDLYRICQASACGAIVDESSLEAVISDEARRQSQLDGRSPCEHALSDGEDYELLLTTAAEAEIQLKHFDFPVQVIGTIIERGFFLKQGDQLVELEPQGYVH